MSQDQSLENISGSPSSKVLKVPPIKNKNMFQSSSNKMQHQQQQQKNDKKPLLFPVNMIRVHYFFSDGLDIEKFLNETEVFIF